MSVLLREIRGISPAAADVLGKAGFDSDPDIQSLTRQDLNELFPGVKRLRLRKTIGDLIQNAKPIKELLDFIPDDCGKVMHVVWRCELFRQIHIDKKFTRPASEYITLMLDFKATKAQPTVRIQEVVRGDLFGSDQTLLERVRQKGGLRVEDVSADFSRSYVTVVFSPISYCLPEYMIEIEIAMTKVTEVLPGGAPVILVLMHLTDDADCPDIISSLGGDPRLHSWHIEDFVNVLYWPSGLLTCPLNERAVAQLHSALLKHSRVVSPAAASGSSTGKTRSGQGRR